MISWIQHHLIRHGRWIFLTLLAVVIVAFVFTIGNTPGCATDRVRYEAAEFYGVDLNSRREMEPLQQRVYVSTILDSGRPPRNDQQLQTALTSRVVMLHLADQIGVPAPGEAALAEFVKTRPAFSGPDGAFSPDAYTRFADGIESNPRFPEGIVIRVLEEDYRINLVREALSGPGYLLPAEVETQVRQNQTTYTVQTAALDFASFDPGIDPSDEELQTFFEENRLRYEIPERIEAGYVRFPADDFAGAVEAPSEEDLRNHFIENRARFVAEHEARREALSPAEQLESANDDGESETGSADEPETPPVTFEDVRESVREDLVRARAERLANEAALEFQVALYENQIERDSAAFNQLLNDTGRELRSIEPYTRSGLRQRRLPADMLEAAFDLSERRYYTDPYPLDDGFGVLIYQGRIDPEIPPYEAVASEVRADFLREAKRKRFNEKGEAIRDELLAKLEAGSSFTEAAEALELSTQSFEPFQPTSPPREMNPTVMQAVRSMSEGEVSSMRMFAGKGTFVYLAGKEVPEVSEDSEELESARDFLRRMGRNYSAGALVNELIAEGMPSGDAE